MQKRSMQGGITVSMKIRPLVMTGMGVAAAFSMAAASGAAFADQAYQGYGPQLANVSGNQIANWVQGSDNQGGVQPSVGEFLIGQANPSVPGKAFSDGYIGDANQGNDSQGDTQNNGQQGQAILHGALPGQNALFTVTGNQGAAWLNISDNQVAGQGAVGQAGVGQANWNSPLRFVSDGNNGTTTQGNWAEGSGFNTGTVSQAIDHGDAGHNGGILSLTGNQAGIMIGNGSDNQGALQGAVGQTVVPQGNANTPIRFLSNGNNGAVTQANGASGTACNTGSQTQVLNHGGNSTALLNGSGNQGGDVNISDNQVGGQGAVGQAGVAQVNANAPIQAFGNGNDGPVTQSNSAVGTASNSGSLNQFDVLG
jgi:hypothetical protein